MTRQLVDNDDFGDDWEVTITRQNSPEWAAELGWSPRQVALKNMLQGDRFTGLGNRVKRVV